MEVLEAIKTRRSIRKYKSAAVPEEDLKAIVEAVRWAPSWANSQCAEVILVKDPKTRERLCCAFDPAVRNPGVAAISTAPVVLVLVAKKEHAGYYHGKAVTKYGEWFMFDLGLAMQNITLAAHGCGLGTVILGYFNHDEVARILEIPDDRFVVSMTPVGYPDIAPNPPARKPLTDLVWYGKFGQRAKSAEPGIE